jgi:hypothetical protein
MSSADGIRQGRPAGGGVKSPARAREEVLFLGVHERPPLFLPAGAVLSRISN